MDRISSPVDRARLAAYYLALPIARDPALDVDEQLSTALGDHDAGVLTAALRELYDACSHPDEFWATDPLTAVGDRATAIELVQRLHVAGTARINDAFVAIARHSPELMDYLVAVGFLDDDRDGRGEAGV